MSKPLEEKGSDVPPEILQELLTPSEVRMVKQRYLIMKRIKEGGTIRSIAQELGVGTDTVVRVSKKLLASGILQKAIRGIKQPSSQWVFGTAKKED